MKLFNHELTAHSDGDRTHTIELLRFYKKCLLMVIFGGSSNYHIMGGGLNVWFRFFTSDELCSIEFKVGKRSLYLGLFTTNIIGATYETSYDYTELP